MGTSEYEKAIATFGSFFASLDEVLPTGALSVEELYEVREGIRMARRQWLALERELKARPSGP